MPEIDQKSRKSTEKFVKIDLKHEKIVKNQ